MTSRRPNQLTDALCRACSAKARASVLLRRALAAGRRRRRDTAVVAALPDVLERVASGLRAGAAPLRALAEAAGGADLPAPLAADLARVIDRAGEGELVAALDRWAAERPLPAVAAVAAAMEVAVGAGGPAAPALDGLATGLRDRHDAAAEIAALSAQARLSAIVVGAAPVVSLALSLLVDPRVAPTLISTAPGRACLLAGIALEGLACLWMHRIVRCGA
jgi:tight adherence protein B